MEILFDIKKTTGIITLNRPQALNALNLSMAEQFAIKLQEWQEDQNIERVLLQGEGHHFCAGGDVKSVHLSGPYSQLKREFFAKEYSLNLQIKNFSKPYLSIWRGVVMGGGVGLSIYGDYRIVTDSTKFAMPETTIGFFPDVGSSFFLSKLKNNMGKYIGLSGEVINNKDLLSFELATHYCPEENLNDLVDSFILDGTIKNYETATSSSFTKDKLNFYNKNLEGSIFDILNNKEILNNPDFLLNKIEKKCPMSLALTALLIDNSKSNTLEECLQKEYRLSQKMTNRKDFGKGIEAVLIEKHHNPKWTPASIKDIDDNELENLLNDPIDNELEIRNI